MRKNHDIQVRRVDGGTHGACRELAECALFFLLLTLLLIGG